eukprot:2092559-Rhodomonas_salina.2
MSQWARNSGMHTGYPGTRVVGRSIIINSNTRVDFYAGMLARVESTPGYPVLRSTIVPGARWRLRLLAVNYAYRGGASKGRRQRGYTGTRGTREPHRVPGYPYSGVENLPGYPGTRALGYGYPGTLWNPGRGSRSLSLSVRATVRVGPASDPGRDQPAWGSA